jgi:multidrug efflux pump
MTVISELFWVTNATTACGSIARFFNAGHDLLLHFRWRLSGGFISCNLQQGRSLSEAADEINSAVARIRMPASINGSLAGTAQLFQQSLGMEPF